MPFKLQDPLVEAAARAIYEIRPDIRGFNRPCPLDVMTEGEYVTNPISAWDLSVTYAKTAIKVVRDAEPEQSGYGDGY